VWVGAEIGSIIAFIIGRFVFRDSVQNIANKYRVFKAIDKVVEEEGLKFTILLRLCPLVPFNAFNYCMGVTGVKFRDYAIGGIGMIPGTIVYVFVGTTISSITDAATGNYESSPATLALLIVGSVLACVLIIYISILTKKYLQKNLDDDEKDTT